MSVRSFCGNLDIRCQGMDAILQRKGGMKMRESRLFQIMYYLLDKGSATAPELAERFEVSVRTIYRDMDALSSAGIPVYAEAGRNGGIRLLSDFVLHQAVVSEQERQDILSALHGLTVISGVYEKDTLEKLSALFGVRPIDWLEVDFSRWGGKPQENKKFELFKTAVVQSRCAKIYYVDSSGKGQERIIQPLKLSYKSRDWYLKAYCTLKQGFRMFKLSRIIRWELLEDCFSPVSFPEEGNHRQQEYDRVMLRFPKEMAYRVYDEFDTNQVSPEQDGALLVTAYMPEDDWLTGYLLSFGGQVEIIEPVHLKEIVAAKAKLIYERYKT